jgi:REP element-mobilizing transposase RayT
MGMNYVAICAYKCNVKILCFCLMSNHFHFVIAGSFEECWKFANEYKRLCGMMIRKQQGIEGLMRDVEIQIKEIDSQAYLENAVAYILRNPIAAGFRLMPHQYEWGSGDSYFRNDYRPVGRRLDSFNSRELASKILMSKAELPDDYIVDDKLMISPLCYVDYRTVEEIFGHPSRLLGQLSAKREADFELYLGIADRYTPDIEELKTSVKELIQIEFGVKAISQLSIEQKIRLCSLMHRNFRASRKQISIVTRLNMETINKII